MLIVRATDSTSAKVILFVFTAMYTLAEEWVAHVSVTLVEFRSMFSDCCNVNLQNISTRTSTDKSHKRMKLRVTSITE